MIDLNDEYDQVLRALQREHGWNTIDEVPERDEHLINDVISILKEMGYKKITCNGFWLGFIIASVIGGLLCFMLC